MNDGPRGHDRGMDGAKEYMGRMALKECGIKSKRNIWKD